MNKGFFWYLYPIIYTNKETNYNLIRIQNGVKTLQIDYFNNEQINDVEFDIFCIEVNKYFSY